jgi:hypothetical protein
MRPTSFLPCDERPPEEEEKEEESKWYSYGSMRVVGLHFGSWPSKDILSKLLSHKTTEKPGWAEIGEDKATKKKPPPNKSRANLHQDRRA